MCYLGPTSGDFSVRLSDFLICKGPDPSQFPQYPQVVLRENYCDSGKHSKEVIAIGVNTVPTGERNQARL